MTQIKALTFAAFAAMSAFALLAGEQTTSFQRLTSCPNGNDAESEACENTSGRCEWTEMTKTLPSHEVAFTTSYLLPGKEQEKGRPHESNLVPAAS